MKISHRRMIAATVLTVASALTASGAQAQSFYLGGSAGNSSIKLNSQDFLTDIQNPVNDEKDTGLKLFGGYRFGDLLSIEAGYADFGKASSRYTNGNYYDNREQKASAWFSAIKADLPLGSTGLSAFGKLGLAYKKASQTHTASAANLGYLCKTCSGSKTSTDLYYGVGMQYDVSKQVSLRIEYEDFGNFGNKFSYDASGAETAGSGRSKVQLWSIGVAFAF